MYLIQTVQTSWRPQLPLPKEVHISDENANIKNKSTNDMERQHHHHSSSHSRKESVPSLNGSQISNTSGSHSGKKWSFGRLFRKKKDIETESSSEEDRKAGFLPATNYPRGSSNNNNNNSGKSKSSKSKSNRNSKLIGAGFDHIVINPPQQHQHHVTQAPVKRPSPPQHLDNEFFLPFETVPPEPFYQNQQQKQQQLIYPPQQQQQYLQQPHQQQFSRSSNSLDRRAIAIPRSSPNKSRSAQRLATDGLQVPVRSSSEEELISLNSSTFSKYRSDESLHSGGQGQNGQSRRSRAARNERYYKRLSRDGEVSNGQVPVMFAPQPTQRWKTQPVPLSVYNGPPLIPLQQSSKMQIQPTQLQQTTSQRLRNAGSLQHVTPYVQWGKVQQQQPKNLQNSVNDSKRSISYDSHIHLQNPNGRMQTKPLPPPPPPRDPMRRVHVTGQVQNSSSGELRPMSYAFDANGLAVLPKSGLNARCVSDDKIWAGQMPLYQSAQSLNMPSASFQQQQQQTPQPTHNRRFITRAERDAQLGKKSLPNGLDIHYIADATPRSRKPIHMLEQQLNVDNNEPPPSSGILRTTKSGLPASPPRTVSTEYLKRLDETPTVRQARGAERTADTTAPAAFKPRSVSTSHVGELRSYPTPMYSEVCKPNRKQPIAKPVTPTQSQSQPSKLPQQSSIDEVDNIICGSLHIKPSQDMSNNNYVELRHKDLNKSHSMPNHYQRRSGEIPTTPNKYDEYVAEKREQHHNPLFDPPAPPQRKLSIPLSASPPTKAASQPAPAVYYPHKKPANLEEAINELEAIYKSLHLGNEPAPVERKERVPTPSDFEKFALARADSYDDEDSPAGEPDPVRDDVAYRNIQLANLQHKANEKQPPFGIPIGPIVPSPHNDYLHVTPDKDKKIVAAKTVPDIIKDDMAVRTLRKDPPGPKPYFIYPCGSLQKKNRATRTQSANIYSLIQRDAAKPSGGDLLSYMELTRNIDRSGSMSDIHHHGEDTADIPATLKLMRNLKEQDQHQGASKKISIPFRHPSQGGAICQLPEKLASPTKEDLPSETKPVPLPRKSLTPEPTNTSHQMEDALNKIAKDAQESSAKLTKELRELRKEALITSSRPKVKLDEEANIEKDLLEIEAVSEAAKRCGKMLLDTLPDNVIEGDTNQVNVKPRKLHKEGKLIKAIDQVSEAANAVCEKILKDIVTTEPPVVVHEAMKVQNKPQIEPLVMPNLFRQLDPIKSDQIEIIAKRCMRQISELAEAADNDTVVEQKVDPNAACNDDTAYVGRSLSKADETLISTVAESKKSMKTQIEEIDQIMQECEAQVRSEGGANSAVTATSPPHRKDDKTTAPSLTTSYSGSSGGGNSASAGNAIPTTSSTTASSFSSSSDCLAKSSSPSASRRLSSSITSFNPYSSSDYLKSPSSEYHAPSTDPIKTFSTTSYDVQSSSATPNITTNSTFSYSPSPPLNLTPVGGRTANTREAGSTRGRERSSSPSQYNSSEELAMIFGIEEKPKQQQRRKSQQQQSAQAGNIGPNASMTTTTTSSSNHASSFACKPDAQLTNPQAACDNVVDNLNVNVATTITTTTLPTNANSPSISRLDTIPEVVLDQDSQIESEDALKLSPYFNKIYASKISIIVDKVLNDEDDHNDDNETLEAVNTNTVASLSPNQLIQFDSLNSLEEEVSSNPDSGNVSLADYPLCSGGTNACLQLQTAYNSRFEVRKNYVTEVYIASESAVNVEGDDKPNEIVEEEFPPLPTEEELLESLKEESGISSTEQQTDNRSDKKIGKATLTEHGLTKLNESDANSLDIRTELDLTSDGGDDNDDAWDTATHSINEDYSSLHENLNEQNDAFSLYELSEGSLSATPTRKRSIVYETPQLNMSISEVRLNYELNESLDPLDNIENEEVAQPSSVLTQINQCTAELEKLNVALTEMPRRRANQRCTESTSNNSQLSLLPWQPLERLTTTDQHNDDKPATSANTTRTTLTLFGELRPANSLTTLEHMLVACTLGVISSSDLFTLFLIIIGVITIIAIVLF